MTPALLLEDVSHAFGAVRAVDRLNLGIAPGELVCLLGPSGCGKSTALRIAAGLEDLQSGTVKMGGEVVADAHVNLPPERRGVGLVFQDYALFPHLRVIDNVAFGLQRLPAQRRRERALAVLAQVGMGDYRDAYPHMLSGGQQQRVALARALAPEPKVLLLDEPFSGLDARLRDQVRDETLHVLKGGGTATLMVTHDPEEAMFMADRIALMRSGRIIQDAAPADLYYRPVDAFSAGFFSQVNQFTATVRDGCVATLFGPLTAPNLPDGAAVDVLIRPEALRLTRAGQAEEAAGEGKPVLHVIASRMLGRTSLVHLRADDPQNGRLHLHSRMPGWFLPGEGEALGVELDRSQAFVFPVESLK
ncbi:ABC transporter ATP-binding protein [Rhodospirillaceae bacterium SYSU D60014]|uniref:ABC transporter ATP-binding protein n=1 Tax=Virgifigura deserti TaxID=2268457 RepID=UPI000E66FD77